MKFPWKTDKLARRRIKWKNLEGESGESKGQKKKILREEDCDCCGRCDAGWCWNFQDWQGKRERERRRFMVYFILSKKIRSKKYDMWLILPVNRLTLLETV